MKSASHAHGPVHGRRFSLRRDAFFLALAGGMAAAVGCTFINSFDDVKARSIVTDTGVPPVDTGGDTNPVEDVGGEDSGIVVDPTKLGLLVEGAEVPTDSGGLTVQQVLTVIDPLTGQEFPGVRENMTVVSVRYDAGRDAWYIFENTSVPRVGPRPEDVVVLHVREWDYDHKKWVLGATGTKDIALLTGIPAPISHETTAVLSQEIAYACFPDPASDSKYGFALLGTSDLKAPVQIGTATTVAGTSPIGLVGVRRSGGSGGNIAYFHYGTCTSPGVGCPIEMLHYVAPAGLVEPVLSGTATTLGTLDSVTGSPSFGTGTDGIGSIIIATPFPSASDTNGTVQFLNPDTLGTDRAPIKFTTDETTKFLRPMAIDECNDVVIFLPELKSQKVHVIPLANPASTTSFSSGNTGGSVAWEPYTRSILAPFKQGSTSSIPAWKVSIDATTKVPTINRRGADWKYDGDLRPNVVTLKTPVTAGFSCAP